MQVALVLGSGGARGYAHIGAIQVLQEQGHEIVAVAGASMGAVIGGVAAAGQLDGFTSWVTGLKQRDVLRMLDITVAGPGVIAANRILGKLHELTGDVSIEDLDIPYTAVATDLNARREVWFQKGPLHAAIRASIAIPGVFTPITINGRLLADGGLLNPLPIEPTAATPADVTVAVALSGPRANDRATPAKESSASRRRGDFVRRVRGATAERRPDTRLTGVITQSLDAMQALITRYRTASVPPDVLVTIPINACGTLEFHRAPEMIALGRQAMETALERSVPPSG